MDDWVRKDVRLVLPTARALDILRRADQWSVRNGGRFERRGASVIVRGGSAPGAPGRGRQQAEAHFEWCVPAERDATLWRIAWDPAAGGSERLIWEALDTLAGGPLQPARRRRGAGRRCRPVGTGAVVARRRMPASGCPEARSRGLSEHGGT